MPDIIWKSIPGFEAYEVSNEGRFRSLARRDSRGHLRPERFLIPRKDKDGYVMVKLSGKDHKAHRMVALAFHGFSNLPQVNHINGIKDDNRPENLEWCTISHNVRHSIETGLRVYGDGLQARTSKGWIQAEKNGCGIMFRGGKDLLDAGFSASTVTSCLKGRRKAHRGFTFSRVPTPLSQPAAAGAEDR